MRNVFSQVVGQTTGQVYPQNVCLWLNLLHTNCLQRFLCKLIVNSLCWTLKCLAQLLSTDMPMDIQVCSVCSGLRWEWGIVPSKLTVCRCNSSSWQVNKTKNFNRTNWSIGMVAWLQLNPLTLVSDLLNTEFLLTRSFQYQAHMRWEWKKISIRGLLVDPVPNSPNWHHKNCMADSRRIYN